MITKFTKLLIAGTVAPLLLAVLAVSGLLTLLFSPLGLFYKIKMPAKSRVPIAGITETIKFVDNKEVTLTPARQQA